VKYLVSIQSIKKLANQIIFMKCGSHGLY